MNAGKGDGQRRKNNHRRRGSRALPVPAEGEVFEMQLVNTRNLFLPFLLLDNYLLLMRTA